MKAFFDTSVLIPVFQSYHAHHTVSFELFNKFPRGQAACGAHSLAEVYSSLTRMPPPYRFRPEQAMLFLSDIQSRLSLIALEADEYFQAIGDFAAMGISAVKSMTLFSSNVLSSRKLRSSILGTSGISANSGRKWRRS